MIAFLNKPFYSEYTLENEFSLSIIWFHTWSPKGLVCSGHSLLWLSLSLESGEAGIMHISKRKE